MASLTRRNERLIVVVGMLFLVAAWTEHAKPVAPSDPTAYAAYAHAFASGDFFTDPPSDLFAQRLGVVAPVAAVFKVFGVHEWTAHLWPLMCALLMAAAVLLGSAPGGPRVAAILLLVTSPGILLASTTLAADVPAAAGMALSVALLSRRKSEARTLPLALLGVFAGLSVTLAVSAKLTAYWVLPVWGWAFLSDTFRRDGRVLKNFHLPAIVAGAIGVGGIGLVSARLWGSPFSRLTAAQALTGQHLWSNGEGGSLGLRLAEATQFFTDFLGLLAPLALLGGLLLVAMKREGWLGRSVPEPHDPDMSVWVVYGVSVLGFFLFGSTSLTVFEPMPLVPRMVLPILVPCAVLAGGALSRLVDGSFSLRHYVLLGTLILGQVVFTGATSIRVLSLAAIGLIAVHAARSRVAFLAGEWTLRAMAVVASLALALPVIAHVRASAPLPQREAMTTVHQLLRENDAVEVWTADSRSEATLSFYFGFDAPVGLSFRVLDADLEGLVPGSLLRLIYVDRRLSAFLEQSYGEEDRSSTALQLTSQWLYEDRGVSLGVLGGRR